MKLDFKNILEQLSLSALKPVKPHVSVSWSKSMLFVDVEVVSRVLVERLVVVVVDLVLPTPFAQNFQTKQFIY